MKTHCIAPRAWIHRCLVSSAPRAWIHHCIVSSAPRAWIHRCVLSSVPRAWIHRCIVSSDPRAWILCCIVSGVFILVVVSCLVTACVASVRTSWDVCRRQITIKNLKVRWLRLLYSVVPTITRAAEVHVRVGLLNYWTSITCQVPAHTTYTEHTFNLLTSYLITSNVILSS